MNDLQLKQLWREQIILLPSNTMDQSIVRQMKEKLRNFDRAIFWRDFREIVACGLVVFWVSRDLGTGYPLLTRIGSLVVILSCLLIAGIIIATRRVQGRYLNPNPVHDYLVGETAKVDRQIRMLGSVLWWYVLPLLSGAALNILGKPGGGLAGRVLVVVILVGVGWFIHWLNRIAVRTTLLPLKRQLESSLQSLSNLEPPASEPKS